MSERKKQFRLPPIADYGYGPHSLAKRLGNGDSKDTRCLSPVSISSTTNQTDNKSKISKAVSSPYVRHLCIREREAYFIKIVRPKRAAPSNLSLKRELNLARLLDDVGKKG